MKAPIKTQATSRVEASIMSLLDEGKTIEEISRRKNIVIEEVIRIKKNYNEVKSWFRKNEPVVKLKELDVVRTSFGTIAVVGEVGVDGEVSLVLPKNSKQKVAWYKPSELTLVGSVKEIVDNLGV